MHISASIYNSSEVNDLRVSTEGHSKVIVIPSKPGGKGSSVNGGELLFLALATCFCNDIYREAAKRNLIIKSIDVKVAGDFGGEGVPGSNIQYSTKIDSDHSADEIEELIRYVDDIAEIHKTLRNGTSIELVNEVNQ